MYTKFLDKVGKALMTIRKRLGYSAESNSKARYSAWKTKSQKGELAFHKTNKWRQSNAFMEQTVELLGYFGFTQDQYINKVIIDLGAGSRLRTKFFKSAKLVAIEPLADDFLRDITWSDLSDADVVYSLPAEELVESCVGKADLVLSLNVLDHCYNFEKIIQNIAMYLKDTGIAFLSFDKHETIDSMHPLYLDEKICEKIFNNSGLKVDKYSMGAGNILVTYGHGEYCMNYTLSKRK